MNTDMNPENLNPEDPEDLVHMPEETQPMDTPDVTAELPIARDPEDAAAPDSPDADVEGAQVPKGPRGLKRKLVAGGVALAIAAALGIGLSLNHEPVNIPDNAPVASIVGGKEDAKAYPASVTLEADGWGEGDGEFSYEIVDANGKSAAKGDIVPGKEASVDLPKGAYALNVTSIPTAKDGKTTWLVPDAVDFVVDDKGASVKVSLAKVDMTDQAAVDAALEKLPEEERAAARKLIEAKRENPDASTVSAPVSKPSSSTVQQAAASTPSGANSNKTDSKPASKPSGSGSNRNDSKPSSGSNKNDSKPSGPSGSNKDDKPAPKPSAPGNSGGNAGNGSGSESPKPSKPAEPEKVWAVVTPAWDEQIYHPAVTHVEKQKVGVQYMADDGACFTNEDDCAYYCVINGLQYSCLPKYEDVTIVDQKEWTETVHHEAVYGWVNK